MLDLNLYPKLPKDLQRVLSIEDAQKTAEQKQIAADFLAAEQAIKEAIHADKLHYCEMIEDLELTHFIYNLTPKHDLKHLLALTGLSRENYNLCLIVVEEDKEENAELLSRIYEFEEQNIGCTPATKLLTEAGIKMDRKRICTLYKILFGDVDGLPYNSRLKPLPKRSKAKMREILKPENLDLAAQEDLLQGKFIADRPCQIIYADIMEFERGREKFYMSYFLDSCTKEVLAYRLHTKVCDYLIEKTFMEILPNEEYYKDAIFHSNRIWIYLEENYKSSVRGMQAKASYSVNASIKNSPFIRAFAGIIKGDFFNQYRYRDLDEAMDAVSDFVEYYNYERMHTALKFKTPFEYRRENFPDIKFVTDEYILQNLKDK